MVTGENFGEFGKSKAIHQSFTHPNLHLKTADSQLPNTSPGKNARNVYLKILSSFEGEARSPRS